MSVHEHTSLSAEAAVPARGPGLATARAAPLLRRWETLAPAARATYRAVLAWLAFFWTAGLVQHAAFQTARFDLGNMTQALWGTAHGHFLAATTASGFEATRLAVHVDPLLALLAPLWWLWPSPLLLVSVSAIGLASGALPVFWLARKHLGSDRAGSTFAVAYLLCPLTQWNAFWDFHPVSLAVPLILYAIWFLDEDRLGAFALFALLAAATKEEIPLAVGCLGIWYAFARGRRLAGACIFAAGATLTLVDFVVVLPRFAVPGWHPLASRYAAVGGTPLGIARTAVTDPGRILHAVLNPHDLAYLAVLAIPFCALFLVEPLLALGACPDLAINLLSSYSHQTSLKYHYTGGILPFLLAASVLGAARLRERLPRAPKLLLATMTLSFLVYTPLPFVAQDVRTALFPDARQQARLDALSLVPGGARVSSSNHLGAHLSARTYVYSFPCTSKAAWVVLDLSDPVLRDRYAPVAFRRAVARLRRDAGWRTVFRSHGVLVLRRVSPVQPAAARGACT